MNNSHHTPAPIKINDTDLLNIHRHLYKSLIYRQELGYTKNRILMRLYDNTINKDNIRTYYNHHINLFTKHLLTGNLDNLPKHIYE